MKNKDSFLDTVLDDFNKATNKPEIFLSNEDNLTNNIRSLLKNCYDFIKLNETDVKTVGTLPELIIENFDLEQIWQQLELQNDEFLTRSLTSVSRHTVGKDRLLFTELNAQTLNDADTNQESTGDELEDDAASDNVSFSGDLSSSDGKDENEPKQTTKPTKSSIVDDEFFKLNEMESFLNSEEKKLAAEDKGGEDDLDSDEEHSIDLFQKAASEDDEENPRLQNPRYNDFFRDSKKELEKSNKFVAEEESEREKRSTLELREERIKNRIESIEESVFSEKPWQLKGEITAENRPQNSLLREVVEFDLTTRPAPVMTEQTTFQLEDVIRQRIKDHVFDSVVRKRKPVETPLEYKKKLVLNQEKSKASLAQIYENEYLQQKEALNPDAGNKDEVEEESHKEVRTMMHALFTKLDALSNFHFTPRMAIPDLRIVSNLPAISMEEVAPVITSDATLLAPEEVRSKSKGDLIGKSERSSADKNRERRKKKLKQKHHAAEKKKKEELGIKTKPRPANKAVMKKTINNKNIDKTNETSGGNRIKSSTAFFKQLQEDVISQIKNKSGPKKIEKKNKLNAKKMKL